MHLTPLAIYFGCVLGAIALGLLMPQRNTALRRVGAVLGAATLGGCWLIFAGNEDWILAGLPNGAFPYYYLFSAIAVVAGVRVITNPRPVYAALWFIMVILSSAGLFLVLSAEFMAFAMVIIYGGAILVTYMFVIMLASKSGDAPADQAMTYDTVAREPLGAVVAGFLLLAALLTISFNDPSSIQPDPAAYAQSDAEIIATVLGDRAQTAANAPDTLTNTERVGLDLFRSHPLGIELAGVILLVSLIGAVVIAKTQVSEEKHLPA